MSEDFLLYVFLVQESRKVLGVEINVRGLLHAAQFTQRQPLSFSESPMSSMTTFTVTVSHVPPASPCLSHSLIEVDNYSYNNPNNVEKDHDHKNASFRRMACHALGLVNDPFKHHSGLSSMWLRVKNSRRKQECIILLLLPMKHFESSCWSCDFTQTWVIYLPGTKYWVVKWIWIVNAYFCIVYQIIDINDDNVVNLNTLILDQSLQWHICI